jgi:citrate synthase
MNRLNNLRAQLLAAKKEVDPKNSITVVDNRSGKTYHFSVENNCIKASDLEQIKTGGEPLRSYDPAFMNTISCVNK